MLVKKRAYPFTIQSQDVDFQRNVTLMALGNILLDAADYNANDNGFGMIRLHEMQCAWALTRLSIEMELFPQQYEEITVETWVEEVERLTTTRNFRILGKEGKIWGNAASQWVMIDLNTRRLKEISALDGIRDYADPISSLNEKPEKLQSVTGTLLDTFKVKYNAIDINGHVNSVRYMEWICNCFSLETYRHKIIKRFDINYISEVLFDEEIAIFGEEIAKDDFRFEIRKNDKVVCRAKIVWKTRGKSDFQTPAL